MSYLSVLRRSLNDKLQQLENEIGDEHPHLFEARSFDLFDDAENLPSQNIFDLIENIKTDLRAMESLLTPTRFSLVELGMLHYKSAALSVAVRLDIASVIEQLDGQAHLAILAKKLNVNEHKLGRILRVLTAEFIFLECEHNIFQNSRHSIALCSTGARSFLSFITGLGMKCSTEISADLLNEDTKNSFSERTAPFCRAVSTNGRTFAEYMTDPANKEMVALGSEGIVGWLNKLTRASLINDYPWENLGPSTVVDVGCGMGDSGIDIMRKYPEINWIYQDFQPVVDSLQASFPEDLKSRLSNDRVTFVAQDYFEPNASKGDVWYMRGVLHEYDDKEAHRILCNIAEAMRRSIDAILIINEVLNGSPMVLSSKPNIPPSAAVPRNQSAITNIGNIMTWSTFSLFGGKERSYDEYESLLYSAGLQISGFYRFRTFTVILECRLAINQNTS